MYVFGGICLFGLALGACQIPSELNETATDEEIAELELIEEENEEYDQLVAPKPKKKQRTVTWCMLLSQKESAFALMVVFFGSYNLMFWSTWLSTFLI
tara:strand:- start:1268 stop:1561 length:294 start_codon:yes stop_codon:yes gene_type:complete